MARVRVFLLGAPLIERDGAPVKLDRRKAIALLAFLALTGRRHQRDALAALLWPEYDQVSAFAYLRRTLWALKAALGADMLIADRGTVGLRQDADLWIDVLAFRALLAAHADPVGVQHDRDRLSAAVALYRGDLLAGFSVRESPEFDEWQIAQAEALRQEAGAALEQLALQTSAVGAADQAIAAARRWVALDPLNEAAQRLLMELYARAGRRSAALRQYHECARLLQRALGLEPQPATTALYEHIRAANLELGGVSAELVAAQYAAVAPHPPASVPVPPTLLIGRAADVAAVCDRLRQPQLRLLTLTGPGGTGKTRLALQVARELSGEFADGAYFVDLAALRDAALAAPTIAQALSIEEVPGQPLAVSLQHALQLKQVLLLLDNFEQILDGAWLVGELLAAAPQLKVLVTSRALLRISGEYEFPVAPLALPPLSNSSAPPATPEAEQSLQQPLLAALAEYPAIQLFVQRAQALQPDFSLTEANVGAVAAICRRLDGLPLAIELAAARVRMFSPQALLARLEELPGAALQILTGGARDMPERQQTLRSTIDWSYNLLDPPEQAMFAQLAVFVGGCSLPAAEAVLRVESRGERSFTHCSTLNPQPSVLDGLTSLVDKSLLRRHVDAGGEPRFGLLETIREYALERLEHSRAVNSIQLRHAEYMLALATQSQRELVGREQLSWLARLENDLDNLRAALAFCLGTPAARLDSASEIAGSVERPASKLASMGLRLAAALWRWWYFSANIGEGRSWLDIALARSPETSAARAQALLAAAALAAEQGDERAALPLFQGSLALWQALGDQAGAARVLAHGSHVLAQGDRAAARRMAEEGVALLRAAGDPIELAAALYNLAEAANLAGGYREARALVEEGLALSRAAGDRWGIAGALIQLGYIASAGSDYPAARRLFEASRALWRELDQRANSMGALSALGWIAWIQGAFGEVAAIFGEILGFARERGDKKSADWALNRLGWAAWARGDLEHATLLFEENWATALALGTRTRVAWAMSGLAHVATSQGDQLRAATLFEQSLAAFRSSGYQVDINWALNNLGRALAGQGDAAGAAALFAEALRLASQQNDQWNVATALEEVAALGNGQAELERSARLLGAAAVLRERIGVPIWPGLRAERERAVAGIRTRLGARAFGAAWAAGQVLPLEQAIAAALS